MNDDIKSRLFSFPYFKGTAEYAYGVRKKIKELNDKDLVIVVDLPDNLEKDIIKAVGKLPRISLIADDMARAIPIIPTDAAIEAIRTGLEYGVKVEFIDASLPFSREKFRGIDKFAHLVKDIGVEAYSKLLTPFKSEYQEARINYMALKLKEILKEDKKILFVGDIRLCETILNKLSEPLDFGYGLVSSNITCKVKEEDVWKISPEIPFFMFLYENNREKPFEREDCILKLYNDNEVKLELIDVYKFARNLAISDAQLYPDLYNIIAASKLCVNDEYAYNVLARAKSYPFTYNESNCEIMSYINYDLEPLDGQRVLTIEKKLEINLESSKREKRTSFGGFIFRFERFPEHFKAERKFANYLRNNYFYLTSSDEYKVEEFQSGIYDGIAIRETLRYSFLDKIYVKDSQKINNTSYVIDFGGRPSTGIFFDSQNYCVGAASSFNNHEGYCWNCIAILPDTLDKKITSVLSHVDVFDSLISCVKIAIEHSDFVYVFTDEANTLNSLKKRGKMKILPLNKIPLKLREDMRCFYIRRSEGGI